MKMKSIDLFCASPASTAICSSMDHRAIVRLGGGATPRTRTTAAPCSSHLPIDPSKLFYHKPRKSSKQNHDILRRKSSADVDDLRGLQSSTTYLLSDKPFLDDAALAVQIRENIYNNNNDKDSYKRLNLDGFQGLRSLSAKTYESPVYNHSPKMEKIQTPKLGDHLNARKSLPSPSNRQVVELRVSIHCRGCEGKLRKHISRMEGVTSFSIDLESKKVTVIGDVSPLGVLTSISRVKNAQFWPSPASSSSSSSSSSTPRATLGTRY